VIVVSGDRRTKGRSVKVHRRGPSSLEHHALAVVLTLEMCYPGYQILLAVALVSDAEEHLELMQSVKDSRAQD